MIGYTRSDARDDFRVCFRRCRVFFYSNVSQLDNRNTWSAMAVRSDLAILVSITAIYSRGLTGVQTVN